MRARNEMVQRAHLDLAAGGEGGDACREGKRLIAVGAIENMVAAELFLRFREGAIRDRGLAGG